MVIMAVVTAMHSGNSGGRVVSGDVDSMLISIP